MKKLRKFGWWLYELWDEHLRAWLWYWLVQRRTKMVNAATIHGRMRVREYYDHDDIEMDLGKRLKVGSVFKYDGDVWEITNIPEYTLDDIETPILYEMKPLSPHRFDDRENIADFS